MAELKLICTYCNKYFQRTVYTKTQQEDIRCPICNDPDPRINKGAMEDSSDVFGYRFSPAFPEKAEKIELFDLSNIQDYHQIDDGH